ncbi:MAG: hypothetical protein ACP5H3_04235 [Candidatus Aenigmatarchaeota archaeon]
MGIKDRILQIWNSKFNPFGNFDDPIPPDWVFAKFRFRFLAYLYWYFWRNPLHNFDRFWIGTGNYPSEWRVWHSKRKWNLILPFFSFRGEKFEFYIGWRPKDDGSQIFGVALRKRKEATKFEQ